VGRGKTETFVGVEIPKVSQQPLLVASQDVDHLRRLVGVGNKYLQQISCISSGLTQPVGSQLSTTKALKKVVEVQRMPAQRQDLH